MQRGGVSLSIFRPLLHGVIFTISSELVIKLSYLDLGKERLEQGRFEPQIKKISGIPYQAQRIFNVNCAQKEAINILHQMSNVNNEMKLGT